MPNGGADFFHVLNPSAARRAEVESFFESVSWPRIWVDRASHPTHLETIMNWAVSEGRRDVALWGGDGTLNRAVNGLAAVNGLDAVRLLLVPVGTCNDFARKLGAMEWKSTVESGRFSERQFDLGVMRHGEGERLFVNNAGFGRRNDARRPTRPNPVLDIFRLRATPIDVEWKSAGRSSREQLAGLLGIFFNAPYFGGGMHFDAAISPEDGRLDAFIVKDQPRWRLLMTFLKGRLGRPFDASRSLRVSGDAITVRADGELFPQADGERASAAAVREISFSVRPRALTMWVAQAGT